MWEGDPPWQVPKSLLKCERRFWSLMLMVIGSPLNYLRQRSILQCHKNEAFLKERGLEA